MELIDSLTFIYSWDNDPWDLYPGHDAIHVVEIQKHATGSTSYTFRRLARSSHISGWLEQQWPSPSDYSRTTATMRLLLLALCDEKSGRMDLNELDQKKKSVKEAMSSFDIPEAALAHTVGWIPGFLKFPTATAAGASPQQGDATSYGIFQQNLSIAWSHAAAPGGGGAATTTQGIVWYEESKCPISRTLLELEKLKGFVDQPMFLGLFSCIAVTRRLAVERRDILKSVRQAELQIGMEKGYRFLGENPWEGITANYAQLSSMVAEASILRTDLCFRLTAVSKFAAQIIEENSTPMLSSSQEVGQQQQQQRTDRKKAAMNETLTLVRAHADQLLEHARGLESRMGVQMNRILSLIAQEDQHFNSIIAQDSRILAIESKRDSTSMKVLASVTTAFLPGTFTASLFAMPLFRWDASGNAGNNNQVVNPRFWIYWAVAIPLTIVTFCAWLFWFRLEAHRERKEDQDAYALGRIRGAASTEKSRREGLEPCGLLPEVA